MASKKKATSLAETLKKNRESASSKNTVAHNVQNYKKRLGHVGIDPEEAIDKRKPIEKVLNLEEDQNVLFDIFEILGRPQQALFGAIDSAQKGENALKGAWEGLKGDKETSGGQLLRNAGIDSDGINGAKEGGLNPLSWGIDDVLGFGLDILADPVDIALLASVPATGGASAPAVATKFLGDTAQTGKILKTTSKADDVMDAIKVADKASDVAKTRYAIRPFQKGAKSISQLAMEGAGKGIKKAFNLGDTAITKGLGKLDKMELSKLTKKANDAEFTNVDDYLEQFGLKSSDFGRKAEGYKTIKEGFKDTFNQAKTKLGEFRIGQRLAEGQNKLIRDLTAPQIEALDNAASDLAKSRLGADVAEDVLKAEKNKILEDFLNYWESGKDTSIKGRNVLNQIGKGYTFEADKKSVKKLRTLLNNISKRSGQKITYTTEFIDDIRRADLDELTKLTRKKGKAFDEGVERLSEQGLIKKGASVEDVKKKISEIRRGANRLTIDEIGDLKAIKNDPVIQKAFDGAGFKYDLRYTADELDYLEALAKDKDFVNFVESNKNIYQDVNRIIKQATNNQLDFTDIINNSRYARRARGDIGDIDERIKTIDELLQSDDLTDTQKEALNAARKDFEGMKERAQGTTNTWSSRKYNQTALITNRETQEEFSKGIKAIDDQISALENSKYNKKIEDLKAQRAEVKEFQKVIKGKTGDSVRGVAQYQKKVKQLNNVRAKIGKAQENIEYIGKRLDDNIKDLELAITKHDIETIDRALSSKITNDFKRLGKANEQMDALLKEYDNIPYDKMTKQQKYNFDRRSSRISKELEDIEKAIRKDKIMVDSATSKKEVNLMDKSEKAMQKAQDLKTSELGYISKKDALLEKELELSQDIADREARLQTKLEKLNFEIRKTPNEDAIIERKIANLAKTQSVLKSQQTANLFNLNFKAGLEDFIKNAEYTNQSNRLFKERKSIKNI